MKRRFPGSNSKANYKSDPSYKVIESKFAVDGFNMGYIPGVEVYFLTHFHSDHYVGLNNKFNKPIYCTKITGELCIKVLKINCRLIKIISINKTVNIHGVNVTPIDANHCPGSVMLFFSFTNGTNILHCGDFRANPEMELHPMLKKNIDTIYLDTTYCDPKYDFPTQENSVDMASTILSQKRQSMLDNGDDFSKLLILCGTYMIGKENFFMGLAAKFGLDIWCDQNKNGILKIAINQDYSGSAHRCQLHVLSMMNLNYNYLREYVQSFKGRFTECIAFKPSGWESSKATKTQLNNVLICGIPYSEHSSFTELRRFCLFCKSKKIISTIPGHNTNKKVKEHFTSWTKFDGRKIQPKITDFFAAKKNENIIV